MENNIKFEFFDEALTSRVIAYKNLNDDDRINQSAASLVADLKGAYKILDANLKEENNTNINNYKVAYQNTIAELDSNLAKDINDADLKYQNAATKEEKTEYNNVISGLKIACKRAKIKALNDLNEAISKEKYHRVELHAEYVSLVSLVTDRVSPLDSLRAKRLEDASVFNLKATLTNKKTWINLVPLFMLLLIIVAYFIGRSITGYKGDLTDVISSGIFVAVVATGAVYIYSQGGFDMSLGNASLMCAIVAALVYNSTQNIIISLTIAIVIGAVLGIINAILATMLNLPVMVMTLTMMNIIAAVNEAILGENGGLITIEGGMISNVWIYAVFLLVFFIICWFIFNYTKVGRRNKFIGSNKVAAKFNGINLMRAGIISFAISGVGLGICGFLFACDKSGSNFGSQTVLGQVGLNVVIAIVFGGMTTSGGPKSKVSCAIIGAFFAVFLDEFFAAISTPMFQVGDYKYMVKGMVFIIVSLANMWDTRSKMLASGGSIQ